MNSVMNVPTRQMAAMMIMGLLPQTFNMPLAIICARPVFSMAVPNTTEPANTIRMFQLMDFMAWSTEQQWQSTIMRAARKAAKAVRS